MFVTYIKTLCRKYFKPKIIKWKGGGKNMKDPSHSFFCQASAFHLLSLVCMHMGKEGKGIVPSLKPWCYRYMVRNRKRHIAWNIRNLTVIFTVQHTWTVHLFLHSNSFSSILATNEEWVRCINIGIMYILLMNSFTLHRRDWFHPHFGTAVTPAPLVQVQDQVQFSPVL